MLMPLCLLTERYPWKLRIYIYRVAPAKMQELFLSKTVTNAVTVNTLGNVPYKHKEHLLYCLSDKALELAAQRGCGASFSRDI